MKQAAAGRTAEEFLDRVVRAAQDAGERLRAEFFRPSGPRGERGKAPVDTEIEEFLRGVLQSLLACSFLGEETGFTPGPVSGYRWLVDPHDGTSEFLRGNRGSAVSIALLRGGGFLEAASGGKTAEVVLGVVHCPLPPDRGADTMAWAEGCGPLRRDGQPLVVELAEQRLERGAIVWLTASAALRPLAFSRVLAPARYIAMPSIAYRLARVAAGDGIAALSLHSVNEYDIAAGAALVRAAGGVLIDRNSREIAFGGAENSLVAGCFAGAPEAVRSLAPRDWEAVMRAPKFTPRLALGFPRRADPVRLARAQGCLLGQVIGDSLGGLVEFRSAAQIARDYPQGVRDLADGGHWNTLAGQPTDDSELALALARSIVRERGFDARAVLAAYRDWLESKPFDLGSATLAGISATPVEDSVSNGSLLRVSPIGIWAAGDPARAARAAREDSALTHPNSVCVEACAGYAAAIAAGVAGGAREAMLAAALAQCGGAARQAIQRAQRGERPRDYESNMSWVLLALQNAFHCLVHAPDFEQGLMATIGAGGDTDTNGAIAGALLGALHGRDAVPARWRLQVLACRPSAEAGAPEPRPMSCWPDDVLDVAEALSAL